MRNVRMHQDSHSPGWAMSAEDRERIARLEANQQTLTGLMSEVRNEIKDMRKDFTRAKGIYAGVVMTVSVIWATLLGVWQFVRHKVT